VKKCEVVEYGIQRRSIYLVPPSAEDLEWIYRSFDDPAIYEALGLNAPSGAEVQRRREEGDHVFGVIREVKSRERIGFVVVFPPSPVFDAWSFAYAIPDARHRNAFFAINTTDAMAHYMFEHLRVDALGWETREGKTAADAVVRRLGYTASEARVFEGRTYQFYRITIDDWRRRREKIGGAFVKLNPPYWPIG
jgi:RimJ/RimL family protein N-acetyltransferase